MEATIGCDCGSTSWAIESPITDDSQMTCENCGAVTTLGKAKAEAAKARARRQIEDALGDSLGRNAVD